jgi:hypothetical protein
MPDLEWRPLDFWERPYPPEWISLWSVDEESVEARVEWAGRAPRTGSRREIEVEVKEAAQMCAPGQGCCGGGAGWAMGSAGVRAGPGEPARQRRRRGPGGLVWEMVAPPDGALPGAGLGA